MNKKRNRKWKIFSLCFCFLHPAETSGSHSIFRDAQYVLNPGLNDKAAYRDENNMKIAVHRVSWGGGGA
ncbi:MAG: hypothetical protein WHT06_10340, partial [Desulfobacterales bacterium]